MRKILLVVVCLLTFLCAKAQTYSSGHLHVALTDSMLHDSTQCSTQWTINYSITVDSSFAGDSVLIVDTSGGWLMYTEHNTTGASPWTFLYPYSSSESDCFTTGLVYTWVPVVKVVGTVDTVWNIYRQDSLLVTNLCQCGQVSGKVYIDNNSNCTYDAGDSSLAIYVWPSVYESLSSPSTAATYGFAYTWTGVQYTIRAIQSWMTSYTVSIPAEYAFLFTFPSCSAGSYSFTSLPQDSVDFPLLCTSNVDVECYLGGPVAVRRFKPFYLQTEVGNLGCDTVSGTLTLIKDSRVTYDSSLSTFPPTTINGDTLTWSYTGITALSGGLYYWNNVMSNLYMIPDSSLTVGDTVCFRIFTGVPPTDINPANNSYNVCLPIVYSYDPNSKDVSPKGDGTEGFIAPGTDTLTYTINFQNTGSDAAYNVTVIDTLDPHLNASTFKILGTSHFMAPQWLAPNIVQFSFDNIDLPDSASNEPASHGYVRYYAVLNSGLPVGTQIKNTGYIYFDTNPAVVTNTAINTIHVHTASVNPIPSPLQVKVYPNPASDNIFVENLEGGSLSILNVNGTVMLQNNINNNKTAIDISNLPNGVYLLRTSSDVGTVTTKFIKY